ncbi:hypothetical protein D024_1283 [Vibrio parahaemolyticus 3259]|nr:hypothetical protein D024_1283 [Vibrio parahaemolyticus 3259]
MLFHKKFEISQPKSRMEQAHNAALRGEQRQPPDLKHCAVNTKVNSNQNCQAL